MSASTGGPNRRHPFGSLCLLPTECWLPDTPTRGGFEPAPSPDPRYRLKVAADTSIGPWRWEGYKKWRRCRPPLPLFPTISLTPRLLISSRLHLHPPPPSSLFRPPPARHALLFRSHLPCRRLPRLGRPGHGPSQSSRTPRRSLRERSLTSPSRWSPDSQRGTLGNLQTTVEGATANLGTTVAGIVPSGGLVGGLVGSLLGPATPAQLGTTVTGLGKGLGPVVGGLGTSGGLVGNLVGGLVGPVKVCRPPPTPTSIPPPSILSLR